MHPFKLYFIQSNELLHHGGHPLYYDLVSLVGKSFLNVDLFSVCHWSWKGGNKHPYRKRIIWLRAKGLTVAIYCGQEKKRPQRVQPIWSLNRAVTNSSDNPVTGANIRPECLKLNGDPPSPAWQIASDWQSVCLPTNFQLSNNVESVPRDYGINTTLLLFLFVPFLFPPLSFCAFWSCQADSNIKLKIYMKNISYVR